MTAMPRPIYSRGICIQLVDRLHMCTMQQAWHELDLVEACVLQEGCPVRCLWVFKAWHACARLLL